MKSFSIALLCTLLSLSNASENSLTCSNLKGFFNEQACCTSDSSSPICDKECFEGENKVGCVLAGSASEMTDYIDEFKQKLSKAERRLSKADEPLNRRLDECPSTCDFKWNSQDQAFRKMWRCNDGHCIEESKRCDWNAAGGDDVIVAQDCEDGSDEENCDYDCASTHCFNQIFFYTEDNNDNCAEHKYIKNGNHWVESNDCQCALFKEHACGICKDTSGKTCYKARLDGLKWGNNKDFIYIQK